METEIFKNALFGLDSNGHKLISCDCGEAASLVCGEQGGGAAPLIKCEKLVCDPACKAHRHTPGTMGYPAKGEVKVQWGGFHASSWKEWPAAFYYKFLASDVKRALRVWRDVCDQFPPPAPLPEKVRVLLGSRWVCVVKGKVEA